jgi:hypothetical protein
MPLTLTLHATRRPRFTDRASQVPAWRRLHAIADAAYPQLRTLWLALFTDLHPSLDLEALRAALTSGNLLAVESVIAPALAALDTTARGLLPALVRETVERAAEAVTPALRTTLGVGISVRFNVVNDASVQWIEEYAGTQIRDISATTRNAVRAIVRRQFTEGRSVTDVMQDLAQQVGLTSRQAQAVEALRVRLVADGVAPGAVQRQVEAAARKALRLRVEAISRTESLASAHAGQDLLWRQAAERGFLDVERFRRHWILTPDDRLCSICRSIKSNNPNGVGLYEAFQGPSGAVQFPPAHVQCRCAVSLMPVAG